MTMPWDLIPRKNTWLPTPAQQARIDAHWDAVVAGLYVSPVHEFADDAPKLIGMHRAKAWEHLRAAAHHAKQARMIAERDVTALQQVTK